MTITIYNQFRLIYYLLKDMIEKPIVEFLAWILR